MTSSTHTTDDESYLQSDADSYIRTDDDESSNTDWEESMKRWVNRQVKGQVTRKRGQRSNLYIEHAGVVQFVTTERFIGTSSDGNFYSQMD